MYVHIFYPSADSCVEQAYQANVTWTGDNVLLTPGYIDNFAFKH